MLFFLYAFCFNLYCGGFILFCNVCVGFVMCGCFWQYVYCTVTEGFLTLTEVFPCFFLRCKTNARVRLAKTGHGPHSSTLVVICVVQLLFVLFYVLFVCKCVLPPGDNPVLQLINISIQLSFWGWAQSCSKHVEDSNKHIIEEIVRQVGHLPESIQ